MRSRPPRRRKAHPASRLRPFWFLFALAVALGAGALAYAAGWPGFYPRAIEVRGAPDVERAQVLARAQIAPSVNVWLQNTAAMARRIEALPDVRRAYVHRYLPATVVIDVRERTPFARLRSGRATVVVDRSLRVLDGAGAPPHLPVLRGPAGLDLHPGVFVRDATVQRLAADYRALRGADLHPSALSLDRFGGLVATLPGGVRVLLGGDSEFATKLELIGPILAQAARSHRPLRTLDVRAPRTPVIAY